MSKNDTEKQQIIIFKLDEKLFGVDIGQIREITRITEVSPVPNAPSYIKGVTNLRGQVTTVIDLRKKLEIPAKEFDKSTRMMVIESKGSPKGMIVDCVAEVTMIPKADIEETPEITKVLDGKSAYIKGIGKKDNRLIILVDLNKLSLEESDNVELEANLKALDAKTATTPVSNTKTRKTSDNVELEVNLEALDAKTATTPVSNTKTRKTA